MDIHTGHTQNEKPTQPSYPTAGPQQPARLPGASYHLLIYDCWYETMRVVSEAEFEAMQRNKLSHRDKFDLYRPASQQPQEIRNKLCRGSRKVLMPRNQRMDPLSLYKGLCDPGQENNIITHTGKGDKEKYKGCLFREIDFNQLSQEDQERQEKGEIKYVVLHRFDGMQRCIPYGASTYEEYVNRQQLEQAEKAMRCKDVALRDGDGESDDT